MNPSVAQVSVLNQTPPSLKSEQFDNPRHHPDEHAPHITAKRIKALALALITLMLLGLCVLVAIPFLTAITWGIALAIIGKPIHDRVFRFLQSPNAAAILTTILIVVMILVPLGFVSYQVAREASDAAEHIQQQSQTKEIHEQVAEVPMLGRVAVWMEQTGVNVETELRKLLVSRTEDIANLVKGSLFATIQFLMTVFILYYLFRDRKQFSQGLRDHLPLSNAECDTVFTRFAGSIHAGLYATLITSLIAGISGGSVFWLAGLSAPILWGAVMFVLSFLPIVGTGLVWGPAVIFLAVGGHWLSAFIILGWGILTFILVDNLLFMRLAGNKMRIHEVPTLIAFLGGIAVFGIAGMILGPAILALTEAFLVVWRKRMQSSLA